MGCAITGHGESILKLGSARAIVDDIQLSFTAEESLYKHFSCMSEKFDKVGGAIVLQSNGRWATYFTSDEMPYAVIENDMITFGARMHEERKEMYTANSAKECRCDCFIVITSVILEK